MFEFWKNEWKLFLEDLGSVKNMFSKIFGAKNDYLMLDSSENEINTEVNNESINNTTNK